MEMKISKSYLGLLAPQIRLSHSEILNGTNSHHVLKSGEIKEFLAKGIPRMNLTGQKVTCLCLSALGIERGDPQNLLKPCTERPEALQVIREMNVSRFN